MIVLIFLIILIIASWCINSYKKESFVSSSVNDSSLNNTIKQLKHSIKNIKVVAGSLTKLLEKQHIDYWIDGGTLLGAIRHNDIIPWDDDFDICIKSYDIQKFMSLEKTLKDEGYRIDKFFAGFKVSPISGKKTKYEWNYPFCDIFLMDYDDKNKKYVLQNSKAKKMWPNAYYASSELFPLKKYKIGTTSYFGPNIGYAYLNRQYGIDWPVIGYQQYDHQKEQPIKRTRFIIPQTLKNHLPYLWVYWDNIDGGKTPDYIKLCRETMWKHCGQDFIIMELDKNNITHFLPDIEILYDNNLKIQHKVDYYRILLLKKYGGLYLDSDTIVMRSPIEIIKRLDKYDFVGFGCTGLTCTYGYGIPSNGVMASRPNGALISETHKMIVSQMKNNSSNKSWGYFDFGKKLLWKAIKNLETENSRYKYYHYSNHYDGTRDKNGKWVVTSRIFGTKTIDYKDPNKLLFIILYNSGMDDIRHMTRAKLLNDSGDSQTMQITKFLQKSLKL